MRAFGLEPASFVFPGNDPGNFDVLSDSGIRSVRWFPKVGVELALPVRRGDGLWAFHSSLAIESRSGKANCAVRLSRLKSYLEQAIAEHLVLHVWFHPSFLPAHLDLVLTPFLRHCANLRENGKLDVFTMGSLTRQMESSSVHDRNRLP